MADRKEFMLRIDQRLHDELRRWADDELRSLNAQVEFLLRRAVEQRRRERSAPLEPDSKKDGSP